MSSQEQEHEFSFKSLFIPFTAFKSIQWIIFIGLVVYANMLFNGFVWDDIGQIVTNTSIQSLLNIPQFFTGSTFYSGGATNLAGIFYKPLLPLMFSIIYSFWGKNAFGFHLFSLILHIINAILIFLLFSRLFKSISSNSHVRFIAFILSVIFLVHPANVEAVSYISALQELLYVFFLLLALLLTISWSIEKEVLNKKLIFISACFLFSLLSKESGIIILPLLIAYTLLFIPSKAKVMTLYLGSAFVIYSILRFGIAKIYLSEHAVASPIVSASLMQRLTTIPYEVFSYLRLVFFPKDLFISQMFVIRSVSDPRLYISLITIIIVFCVGGYLVYKLRSKLSLFFLLWIFFSFFLILNIFPLDFSLAERWLYGPLIGILGLLGSIIIRVKNKRLIYTILIVLIGVIPLLSLRTFIRNSDWKDNITLFSHDIILNPSSFEIQEGYGVLISNAGNLTEGKKHLIAAIKLSPTFWAAYANLGIVYEEEKDYSKAGSLYLYAIDHGRDYQSYEALSVLEYRKGTIKDALSVAINGLKYFPDNPTLNLIAALSYYKIGNTQLALLYAQRTYDLHPTLQTYTAVQKITNGENIDDIIR